MSELCPIGRSEGYEIRDDEVARIELRRATQILRAFEPCENTEQERRGGGKPPPYKTGHGSVFG